MSELAKRVKDPDSLFYLIEFQYADPVALQCLFERFPELSGVWPDLSEYSQDELDEIDALIEKLGLVPLISEHPKSVLDDDAA